MDLIVIIGSGAVGKMTVGQELMKITDFRLFHNHMMIEPVIQIFGKFDGQVVSKLREDIFDAFMKTNYQGMIFTFMWAFDMQTDWDYIKTVTDKFEATGGLNETKQKTVWPTKLPSAILKFLMHVLSAKKQSTAL